jgi:homoserine dehydrogenase
MTKRIALIQLGLGGVGRALVRHILTQRSYHAQRLGLSLQYIALADRDGIVINRDGLSDERLTEIVAAKAQGARLRALPQGRPWDGSPEILEDLFEPNAIVVDVTATEATVPVLRAACARGLGIVLANKLPLAGPYELFRELTANPRTRFETTVGAALPIIVTIQSFLLDTGDAIQKIRGCLSGTLNMICQRLEQGQKFSEIVREARAQGHTEPDPREDLSGRDAARKALILARLLGYPLEFEDVSRESLYPPEWDALSVEDFLVRLSEQDARWSELSRDVQARGERLRYVVEVTEGRCQARLERLKSDDELVRPGVADSVVAVQTARYRESSLIIRGKGSGPELTASGVLADILILAR